MKPYQAICIALLWVVPSVAAQDALSLSSAVDAALANHPLVKASEIGMDQARNRDAEARANRAPKISLSETVTRGNNPVYVFGSLLEQSQFGPENFSLPSLNNPSSLTNFRSAASASLSIFDGGKTNSLIDQAKIGKDVAQIDNDAVKQRVRFGTLQNYLDLMLAAAAVEVAQSALQTAESDVSRARDRVDAGLAVESDLLSAQVQLAEFRQQEIQAEGQRAIATAALNIAMGAPPETPRALMLQLAPKTFEVASPDALLDRAKQHRPDYRQSESRIQIANRRVSEQRSANLPQVKVFASVGASGSRLINGSGDYAVGAGATFDVLDRGRSARIAQAEADERLAGTERNRILDQIRNDVLGAYHRYRAAEQQVDVARSALSQAMESLRIVQNRYEAGLTTITEMLRAETAVVRARMNVVAATHDQYLGFGHVLLSVGQLNDVKEFEP